MYQSLGLSALREKSLLAEARRSADRLYRQIPAFVQANFVVRKLDEMAARMVIA